MSHGCAGPRKPRRHPQGQSLEQFCSLSLFRLRACDPRRPLRSSSPQATMSSTAARCAESTSVALRCCGDPPPTGDFLQGTAQSQLQQHLLRISLPKALHANSMLCEVETRQLTKSELEGVWRYGFTCTSRIQHLLRQRPSGRGLVHQHTSTCRFQQLLHFL